MTTVYLSEVLFRQYDPIVRLEAADATARAEKIGTRWRLLGKFFLNVTGFRSKAVAIDRYACEVEPVNGNWELSRAPQHPQKLPFEFGKKRLAEGAGPWVIFETVELFSLRNPSVSEVFVRFPDVRVDLVGPRDDPGKNLFRYPRANGQTATANLIPSPEQEVPRSYYLKIFADRIVLDLGILDLGRKPIDHIPGLKLRIQKHGYDVGASLEYVFLQDDAKPKLPLSIEVPRTITSDVIYAEIATATGLTFNDATKISIARIRGGHGWLSCAEWTNTSAPEGSNLKLSVIDTKRKVETTLTGKAANVRLNLPLSPKSASGDEGRPQFVYRKSQEEAATHVDLRKSLFEGVEVRGLRGHRQANPNSLARLDTNWFRFVLLPAPNPKFVARGGQSRFRLPPSEIERATSPTLEETSWLVPKLDQLTLPAGTRTLKIPIASVLLTASTTGLEPSTVFILDGEARQLSIRSPILEVLPVGSTGGGRDALMSIDSYERIRFTPKGGSRDVVFSLTAAGLEPPANWLADFRPVATKLDINDHPGAAIGVPGQALPYASAPAPFDTSDEGSIVATIRDPSGKEIVVYTALSLVAIYNLVPGVKQAANQYLKDNSVKLDVRNLGEPLPPWVIGREVDNVILRLESTELHDFIERNLNHATGNGPKPEEFRWPLAAGMSILLWKRDGNKYADAIATSRRPQASTRIVVDLAGKPVPPASWPTHEPTPLQLGLGNYRWNNPTLHQRLTEKQPWLWPQLATGGKGSRLDPSDPLWRGFFFKDLPLTLSIDRKPADRSLASEFFKQVNENLLLDYGWKDESGTTWKATLQLAPPIKLINTAVLQVDLKGFEGSGSGTTPSSATGTIGIVLPTIVEENTNKALTLEGRFTFDLTKEVSFSFFDLSADRSAIATLSLPGFGRIEVLRARSDMRTLGLDLRLFPKPKLLEIFPGLTDGVSNAERFMSASLVIDLDKPDRLDLAILFPAVKQTPLFGIWPASVQGIRLIIADGTTTIVFRCALSLGIAGFEATTVDVILEKTNGGWQFNLAPVAFSAAISLPSFSIEADLAWQKDKKDGESGPIDSIPAARERAFWGRLYLKSSLIGRIELEARIWADGNKPHWVAALTSGQHINVGFAKIKDPVLLVAKGADVGGSLGDAILDPESTEFRTLDRKSDRAWLSAWGPSDKVGLVVAAAGGLSFDERITPAPAQDERDKRTTIILTDSGFARVDAWTTFFGIPLKFGIAIDLVKETLAAAFQGPSFNFPPGTKEFAVSAGEISLKVGYGARKVLKFSMGWPLVGDTFKEDWSKAVEIHWDGAFPLNTFAGGVLCGWEQTNKGDVFRVGFALKAGWTKEYSKEIISSKLAKTRATLGVFLGGIIYFQYGIGGGRSFELLTTRFHPDFPEDHRRLLAYANQWKGKSGQSLLAHDLIACIADDMRVMDADKWVLVSTLFAEFSGSASAELLGVTIASIAIGARALLFVCGNEKGICQVSAEVNFSVTITIACVRVTGNATIPFKLIDRAPCPVERASSIRLLA